MQIQSLRLAAHDVAALRSFYATAFDAQPQESGVMLGEERIGIVAAQTAAERLFAGNETGFQHFAIVVADIDAAFARLTQHGGWRPISLAGPERLPEASGGAAAFKFRDPSGHPLELLQFPDHGIPALWRARFDASPDRMFHGLDHTALTGRDAEVSLSFYEQMGFVCSHRQINAGAEQRRLDGLADAPEVKVEILSLSPGDGARPGIELLAYIEPPAMALSAADGSQAATAMVFSEVLLPPARDPDGHRLEAS
jgi:catechol 2,3-dioxygenase-like lactoylglutathione lyase family enzyme